MPYLPPTWKEVKPSIVDGASLTCGKKFGEEPGLILVLNHLIRTHQQKHKSFAVL